MSHQISKKLCHGEKGWCNCSEHQKQFVFHLQQQMGVSLGDELPGLLACTCFLICWMPNHTKLRLNCFFVGLDSKITTALFHPYGLHNIDGTACRNTFCLSGNELECSQAVALCGTLSNNSLAINDVMNGWVWDEMPGFAYSPPESFEILMFVCFQIDAKQCCYAT